MPATWTLIRPGPATATGVASGSGSAAPPGACSVVGSLAGNVSASALSALPFVRAFSTPNVPSESRNAVFACESGTRSWGRRGPASDGTTVERSSSSTCEYVGSSLGSCQSMFSLQ